MKARKPHGYQKRGVEWLVGHGGAFVLLRPGKGKTSIVLRALLALKDAGLRPRALVVAPLRVATNVWPGESGEWAGSEWKRISELKIRMLHGDRKDFEAAQDADVYVINPDGLKWLFEDGRYARFNKMRLDTLVWDESTKIKHTNTKRFKMLKPVLKTFARRWALTGSPVPRAYLDLFGQVYVVDLGRALGQYITHYRMRYFTPVDRFGWNWVLQPGAERLIQAAVAPYVFQLTEKEERAGAKEPTLVTNVVRVDLPDSARKLYDEMEEELIVELNTEVSTHALDRRRKTGEKVTTVLAVNSGVAAMKCAQIANGGLYHDKAPGTAERRAWSDLHAVKLEAVEEIVDELQGRPAMVVYEFEHDLARLRGLYPRAPWIGGGVSAKESARILAGWNASEYPVLLVQPQTVSHGINAQYGDAQDIIWHSLIYDYEIFDQLVQRLQRQGSRHREIFNHLIVCRDTVDEAKLRSLRRKEKTQNGFLAALREYALTKTS